MGAKDTVMSDATKRQFRYIPDKPSQDISRWDIDGAIELQAEISFEAGIREGSEQLAKWVLDWLDRQPSLDTPEWIAEALRDEFKALLGEVKDVRIMATRKT